MTLSLSNIKKPSRKLRFYILFPVISSLLVHSGCQNKKFDEQSVVAEIGPAEISVHDFRVSYELSSATPARISAKQKDKKKAHLDYIVEKQLLTFGGLDRGIDKADDVERLLKWYEKQAVIRELYRNVVGDRVSVGDEEIRDAFLLLNERLSVRQILVPSAVQAEELYDKSKKGESFETLAVSFAGSGEELQRILTAREFTWGELDENLETAIFGLNRNEVSAPVRTASGYHIVQLLNRKKNVLLTEYDYEARRNYVETIIRRRKEAKLARQYAISMMEQLAPRAVGPVLLEFTERAKQTVKNTGQEAAVAEPCFPITVSHGHVLKLFQENVDFVLTPNMIVSERSG
jgi:hypothetical protein